MLFLIPTYYLILRLHQISLVISPWFEIKEAHSFLHGKQGANGQIVAYPSLL